MKSDDRRRRIWVICREILKHFGLTQGHLEIHSNRGRPTKVDVMDKSFKFDDEEFKDTQESRPKE